MADNFTFPGGGTQTYVPQLHGDLIVEYSRNPAKFPINRYINVRKVDKMLGYYVQMRNDGQARFVNEQDVLWPDGNDAPVLNYGTDEFDFKSYACVRRAYTARLGYLGVDQAAWYILAQQARFKAQLGMTHRSKRVASTLTTSANWGGNVGNASTLGGATWAAATSATPAIRSSIMKALINVQLATLASVDMHDYYLVFNPNTAKVVATSQEWIDFIKQSPESINIWKGEAQYSKYNIPEQLFGINAVVDDTVYNSAGVNQTPTFSYTFPDNVAVLLTKQQAVQPSAGAAFSTFELFAYQEFETFVYNDVVNRRYDLQVVENVADNFVFAPSSGYMINTNS